MAEAALEVLQDMSASALAAGAATETAQEVLKEL